MVTILGMGRGKHMECNNVKEKEGNILIDAALKLIVLWFACLILKKYWIRDLFYSTLVTLAAVFCTVSIIVYAGLKIRSVIYAAKTGGRNYKEDRRKYNMSYHELLDFFGNAEQHSMSKSDFPAGFWKEEEGIMLGDSDGHLVRIPSDAEANIFAAGTPGSGKTSGIVIPTCLRYGGSVLAVDIKGDIQVFFRHGGTFQMPARTAFAPGAFPVRFSRF